MSLQKEESCVLCHELLSEEDDVVYCPVCGAPHHRSCYKSIDKCALEEFHGTENQYDIIKSQEFATEKEPPKEDNHGFDGAEKFETPFGNFSPIDFLGGVSPEEQIEDGVTAKDAANFVLSNTIRYIPKFKKMNVKNKISWNFMAFLFPSGWFLSRKMYKNGIIVGVLQILAALFTIPFQNTLENLGINQLTTYADVFGKLAESTNQISQAVVFIAFVGGLISIAVSILSALFGDWLYKKHTVATIHDIKSTKSDDIQEYRKKGGVNILMFLVGALVVQYVPTIVSMLI